MVAGSLSKIQCDACVTLSTTNLRGSKNDLTMQSYGPRSVQVIQTYQARRGRRSVRKHLRCGRPTLQRSLPAPLRPPEGKRPRGGQRKTSRWRRGDGAQGAAGMGECPGKRSGDATHTPRVSQSLTVFTSCAATDAFKCCGKYPRHKLPAGRRRVRGRTPGSPGSFPQRLFVDKTSC